MVTPASREQTAQSRVAQLYRYDSPDHGTRSCWLGRLERSEGSRGLVAVKQLFGPMWRALFRGEPPEVLEVRNRVDILRMLRDHNRRELVDQISEFHRVSRVIAEQMLERRLDEINKGAQIDG